LELTGGSALNKLRGDVKFDATLVAT